MTILALIGAKALYLLWAWLASSIVASLLSARKGYGEKPGLATGLLLSAVGVLVWLVWPARQGSLWKTDGPLPKRGQRLAPPPVTPDDDAAADGGDTAPGPGGQSAS
jgi:membrane protein implicated in regulation of membrane protease activity